MWRAVLIPVGLSVGACNHFNNEDGVSGSKPVASVEHVPAAGPKKIIKESHIPEERQIVLPVKEYCGLSDSGLWTLKSKNSDEITNAIFPPLCLSQEWQDKAKLAVLRTGTQYLYDTDLGARKRFTVVSYVRGPLVRVKKVIEEHFLDSYRSLLSSQQGGSPTITEYEDHAWQISLTQKVDPYEESVCVTAYSATGKSGTIIMEEVTKVVPQEPRAGSSDFRSYIFAFMRPAGVRLRWWVEKHSARGFAATDLGTRGRLP